MGAAAAAAESGSLLVAAQAADTRCSLCPRTGILDARNAIAHLLEARGHNLCSKGGSGHRCK